MSKSPAGDARKRLPVNPSLQNLKKRAKRLARCRPELSLQQAQHQIAVEYGCANWVELAHVVETMGRGATQTSNVKNKMEPLPAAANRNDLDAVHQLLRDGPFTQHDLDLALARAVLRFNERRAIAELLIDAGADPDGQYGSNYGPIIFATGETGLPHVWWALLGDSIIAVQGASHVQTKVFSRVQALSRQAGQ